MSNAKRLYQLSYKDNPNRPVFTGDFGELMNLSGFLVQGMGSSYLILLPSADSVSPDNINVVSPSLEEISEILRASDDPEIYKLDESGNVKIIHRKCEYAISGAVQQQIWHRDNYTCLYCGRSIPSVQLTIDHVKPLELGGENNQSNYMSCCRKCQKSKGCRDPKEFCDKNGYDYDGLMLYLQGKCSLSFIAHLAASF
jgi:hypothetical protein